ncbi:MAG: SGNH/GDSL hydrolase family protein [Janthinobacterium lividum]
MTRLLFEHHPRIGHRYVSELRARVRHESGGYLVATNRDGFRTREFTARSTPGRQRVLLFGDSFTAGDGVSNGRRFGDLLERVLPDLEVLNFGLPATGTDQQYLSYLEYAAGLGHDLVVIAVLVENIRRVMAPYRGFVHRGTVVCYAKPYFTADDGRLTLHNVPVRRDPLDSDELQAAIDRSQLAEVTQGFGYGRPVPEYDDPEGPAWQLLRLILTSWIRDEQQRRPGHLSPVMVVPLPLFSHVEGDADPTSYQARFAELAASTGCHLHDPLPDLLHYPQDERRAFRFVKDIHPTPAGHHALAASMAPALERALASQRPSNEGRP